MNSLIMPAAFTAASFFALMVASSPLAAESVHSQRVGYADLDLSQEADVRILDRRLLTAVQAVCGAPSNADPAGKNDIRRCRAETLARLEARRTKVLPEARESVRSASTD